VSTVLLETGLIEMRQPVTEMTLEAPGGLIRVRAECKDGKAEQISVRNLPSFADKLSVPLNVPGLGTLTVDTAFGGDSFVLVDAGALGFEISAKEAKDIARLGVLITDAANAQLGFAHPHNPEWNHISFCAFCGDLTETPTGLRARSAVAIQPGKVDRSPTGTAVSARIALLAAKGMIEKGQSFEAISIIGSRFTGRIVETLLLGDRPAIVPEISGQAWITGVHQHMLDPTDPWPEGYRLSDTWGA
jgi:proline racemase